MFCTSTATRLVPLAKVPPMPASDSSGTVSNDPPPAMALITPATKPPISISSTSTTDMGAHRSLGA